MARSIAALAAAPARAVTTDEIISRGKVIIAIDTTTAPYGMVDANMQPAGFDIDVANLVGKALGVPVEFVTVTSPGRIPSLLTNRVDMVISIFSITATSTETSLVCAAHGVPAKAVQHGPLTGFAVAGTLDLALVGVLHDLLGPLVEEEISVFTISTYDTDWILVRAADADRAAEAWRRRGHVVAPALPDPKKDS